MRTPDQIQVFIFSQAWPQVPFPAKPFHQSPLQILENAESLLWPDGSFHPPRHQNFSHILPQPSGLIWTQQPLVPNSH